MEFVDFCTDGEGDRLYLLKADGGTNSDGGREVIWIVAREMVRFREVVY